MFAEQDQWDQAAADFARAIEIGVDDLNVWHPLALSYLAHGDLDGYRATCARLLERASREKNLSTRVANSVAWTCSIGPNAAADFGPVLRFADHALAQRPNEYAVLNTLGTALYRAGRWLDAIDRLNEGIRTHGQGMPHDWLVLAMAHHRLGHAEDAQRWLQKANEWIEHAAKSNEPPASGASNPSSTWTDRLEIGLLHREATQLLKR